MANHNYEIIELYSQTKSPDVKDLLVKEYSRLVNFAVRKYNLPITTGSSVLEEKDLIQFGMIGLLNAFDRFDFSKGVKFETYAIIRIRGTIRDELRKLDWVPRSIRKKAREAQIAIERNEQKINCGEYSEDIDEEVSLEEDYNNSTKGSVMMEKINLHDTETEGVDIVSDELESDPYEKLQLEEERDQLINAIVHLPQRDRDLVTLYYYEELTFAEIGKILKISESRVFQIHSRILTELKKTMERK